MATLAQPPSGIDLSLPRKKWMREEIDHLLKTGVFDGQRFELIDGELIDKMGQGPRHANAIHTLMVLLAKAFGIERVLVQAPMEAGPRDSKWSQPEPDLTVMAENIQRSPVRHPYGGELLLAVEVADSSIRQDTTRKRDMYGHAGVPEYWVLDLEGRKLLVFRALQAGNYSESLTLGETDQIPHLNISVAELLG
jgi:Uma2 family endonuclease